MKMKCDGCGITLYYSKYGDGRKCWSCGYVNALSPLRRYKQNV